MQYRNLKNKRVCSNCGTTESYINPRGFEEWRFEGEKLFCLKCHNHLYFSPRWRVYRRLRNRINKKKNKPRMFYFMGKKLTAKEAVKTGVCKQCGREGRTHLHHQEYDLNDPLAHTIELCPRCHMTESKRLGQFIGRPKGSKNKSYCSSMPQS